MKGPICLNCGVDKPLNQAGKFCCEACGLAFAFRPKANPLSEVSKLTIEREKVFARWSKLPKGSQKAIELNIEVRRLTNELLKFEGQSNGAI